MLLKAGVQSLQTHVYVPPVVLVVLNEEVNRVLAVPNTSANPDETPKTPPVRVHVGAGGPTHAPPAEQVSGGVHCPLVLQGPQAPAMHAWPAVHCASVVHGPHAPAMQAWPAVHCACDVHAPQTPETHAWPAPHCPCAEQGPQVPITQASPTGH